MLTEEFLGPGHIVFFTRSQAQFDRLTLGIYGEVEFGTETTAGASQRFARRVFF